MLWPAPASTVPASTLMQPSDVLTAGARNPDLLVVLVAPVARAGGLLRVRVDQLHVADVDERLLMDDAALLRAAPALVVDLGVLLDHVDALDQQPLLVRVGGDDRALAAVVPAGDDDHAIALLDLHAGRLRRPGLLSRGGLPRPHSTSGASEMIRMNRFSPRPRPTGPKVPGPRRSPPPLIRTAA